MDHQRKKSVAKLALSRESKQLILGARSKLGLLVLSDKTGKQKSKHMQFENPHAALTWCLEHSAGFLCYQEEDAALS